MILMCINYDIYKFLVYILFHLQSIIQKLSVVFIFRPLFFFFLTYSELIFWWIVVLGNIIPHITFIFMILFFYGVSINSLTTFTHW